MVGERGRQKFRHGGHAGDPPEVGLMGTGVPWESAKPLAQGTKETPLMPFGHERVEDLETYREGLGTVVKHSCLGPLCREPASDTPALLQN